MRVKGVTQIKNTIMLIKYMTVSKTAAVARHGQFLRDYLSAGRKERGWRRDPHGI
jgi:hypothetical protein